MQTPTEVLRHFPVIETKITTAQTRGLEIDLNQNGGHLKLTSSLTHSLTGCNFKQGWQHTCKFHHGLSFTK